MNSPRDQLRADTLLEVCEVLEEGKYKLKWWLEQELEKESKRLMRELTSRPPINPDKLQDQTNQGDIT